jgi:hypothetical protein
MKYLAKPQLFVPLAAVAASLGGPTACGRQPPEPPAQGGPSAGSSEPEATARPSPSISRGGDDAGPPPSARAPDWDLDGNDAARDYVWRYAFGTRRYGDTLDCFDVGTSQPATGGRRRVEVRTAATCAQAGTLRDAFLVDLASDRLTAAEPQHAALARWPDGSSPDGPPGAVREVDAMRKWKGPLKDALQGQRLAPIRVQTYGRGTYPVVTLAGWHGAVVPGAAADTLRGLVDAVCEATGGAAMGLFGGLDRTLILRIRCSAGRRGARWEKL